MPPPANSLETLRPSLHRASITTQIHRAFFEGHKRFWACTGVRGTHCNNSQHYHSLLTFKQRPIVTTKKEHVPLQGPPLQQLWSQCHNPLHLQTKLWVPCSSVPLDQSIRTVRQVLPWLPGHDLIARTLYRKQTVVCQRPSRAHALFLRLLRSFTGERERLYREDQTGARARHWIARLYEPFRGLDVTLADPILGSRATCLSAIRAQFTAAPQSATAILYIQKHFEFIEKTTRCSEAN